MAEHLKSEHLKCDDKKHVKYLENNWIKCNACNLRFLTESHVEKHAEEAHKPDIKVEEVFEEEILPDLKLELVEPKTEEEEEEQPQAKKRCISTSHDHGRVLVTNPEKILRIAQNGLDTG